MGADELMRIQVYWDLQRKNWIFFETNDPEREYQIDDK